MTNTTSLWGFIANADLVVKLVLLMLLSVSVLSWSIIGQRLRLLRDSRRSINEFGNIFRSKTAIEALKQSVPSSHSGLGKMLQAGISEYERLSKTPYLQDPIIIENCQREMQITQQKTLQQLENNVSLLATIGSTAPYVGLFRTVWGIMSSFQMLGGVQQATIAMVAPGISEALIATAIGLFTAIPAVVAYNRFANQIDRIQQDYDIFREQIVAKLQQQLATQEKKI